jgi:hypothetical protein
MLAIKPAFALLALGLGGLLSSTGVPTAPASAASNAVATTAPASTRPSDADLRSAVQATLQARVRSDLDDPTATLALKNLTVASSSLRSLEAHGEGVVSTPGARPIPVEVVGVYDLVDGRLESVEYAAHPVETDLTAVDRAVRDAIGRRIGERIAAEFADQPARFELIAVSSVDYGKHRTRLQGAGLTDFGAEGRAYTPFVATLDKHTGELLELQYDLLQEDEAATTVAAR